MKILYDKNTTAYLGFTLSIIWGCFIGASFGGILLYYTYDSSIEGIPFESLLFRLIWIGILCGAEFSIFKVIEYYRTEHMRLGFSQGRNRYGNFKRENLTNEDIEFENKSRLTILIFEYSILTLFIAFSITAFIIVIAMFFSKG